MRRWTVLPQMTRAQGEQCVHALVCPLVDESKRTARDLRLKNEPVLGDPDVERSTRCTLIGSFEYLKCDQSRVSHDADVSHS